MPKYEWESATFWFKKTIDGESESKFVSELCFDTNDDETLFKTNDRQFMYDYRVTRMQCIKCNHIKVLPACNNCDNCVYLPGFSTSGQSGLFCKSCDKGFTSWTCEKCGMENPVSKSLIYLSKSGACFIASAVYGSYDSPEVMTLRTFRDDVLSCTFVGRSLIEFYYLISPPLARTIRKKEKLRRLIKKYILDPIVYSFQTHKSD
jgi:hypothetical protein